MTTTYTTPIVPFADFADYNPGHGTETVRDTVGGLRYEYGGDALVQVEVLTESTGHRFAVTGPIVDMARLAALYGQAV